MKAVLEFNYPDDETRLRRVIHAEQAFNALIGMSQRVKYRWRVGDEGVKDMLDTLDHVRYVLDTVLTQCGEPLR